jgi:hypothetical protein
MMTKAFQRGPESFRNSRVTAPVARRSSRSVMPPSVCRRWFTPFACSAFRELKLFQIAPKFVFFFDQELRDNRSPVGQGLRLRAELGNDRRSLG